MNECQEIQEQLHDWIDLELDRDEAAIVARHVDECVSCTDIARAIRNLKTLVRQKADRSPLPPRLEAKVRECIALETLRSERSRIIQFPLRRLRWAAAAVFLIAAVPLALQFLTPSDLHAQITESALESHLQSLGSEDLPRFTCMSNEEAEKSLKMELGFAVALPDFPEQVCLKGLSVKKFHGKKVGKVFYDIEGQAFSLFVVPAEMRGGTALCCCHSGQRIHVYCTNEGDYCLTFVTSLEAEPFRDTVLEPALKRSIQIAHPKPKDE